MTTDLDRLQALEQEVSDAEARLATLQASERAMAIEVEAARDPRQLDDSAFAPNWWESRTSPGAIARTVGLAGGMVAGVSVVVLVRVIVLVLGW